MQFSANTRELMQTLDLNAKDFRKLKRAGVLIPRPGGKDVFDLAQCVPNFLQHLEQKGDCGKQRRELDAARTRIHLSVAARNELLLAVLRGQVLFAEDIFRRWGEEAVVMKGRMLAICSRVIAQVAGASRSELQKLFRQELFDAVAQLKLFEIRNYLRRGSDHFFESNGNSTNGHKPVVRTRRSFSKKKLT